MIDPALVLAALSTTVAVAMVVRWIAPPATRLAGRVRPYHIGAGREQVIKVTGGGTAWSRLREETLGRLARKIGALLDPDGAESTRLRLRQTGLFPGLDDDQALEAYRVRQLGTLMLTTAMAAAAAVALQLPLPRALALCGLGALVGATRSRGRVDRAIRRRRELMRIEIYTINQLLAMRVRAGGGVVQAVQEVVARGRGEVIEELAEALRLHRAGMRAIESFSRLATLTPEPACARTYSLLSAAEERGSDLARALLDLSEDVRESRREAMRRSATRRRAAMLVPIIGILAPVMLLFVGAPLPQVIFNWR
ncbi:MAG: type II secretion system F family protein [Actinomycetota bacterium]